MAIKGQVFPHEIPKEKWIKFSNDTFMFPQNFSDEDFYWEMKQHFRWGIKWIYSYDPPLPTIISINILALDIFDKDLIRIFKKYNMKQII